MLLLFSFVLAKLVGAAGAGAFFESYALFVIVCAIARFGQDLLVLRDYAQMSRGNAGPNVLVSTRAGWILAFVMSLVIFACMNIFFAFGEDWIGVETTEPSLRILSLGVVPYSLLLLFAEAYKGRGHPIQGIFYQSVSTPALGAILLMIIGPKYGTVAASISWVLAAVLSVLIAWMLHCQPDHVLRVKFSAQELRGRIQLGMPFMWIGIATLAMGWGDIVVLGIYRPDDEVGAYAMAARLSQIVGLVMIGIGSAVAATLEKELHSPSNRADNQRLVTSICLIYLAFGMPIIAILFIFAGTFLNLFGTEFVSATLSLRILLFGQVVNLLTGPVSLMLVMGRHERSLRTIVASMATVLVVISVIFVPHFGMAGAAFCAAFSRAGVNIVAFVLVLRLFRLVALPVQYTKLRRE